MKALALLLFISIIFTAACREQTAASSDGAVPRQHQHHAPHGGTPVVLGDEVYHIEFVYDAPSGTLQAYLFDGEMENFIRAAVPSFDVTASINGQSTILVFKAVPNLATGETVGDSSLFETQANWLKSAQTFDAELKTITIRGTNFNNVKFNFPKGNDKESGSAQP